MSQLTWNRGARSVVEMTGDGCFKFAVLIPDASATQQPIIVCGLNNASASDKPEEIRFGFMVRESEFCVVENGVAVTAWETIPLYYGYVDAAVFRIYRRNGVIAYTVSPAESYRYTSANWQTDITPRFEGDDNDPDAVYSAAFGAGVVETRGELVYTSDRHASESFFLDVAFSRDSSDIYGDDPLGSIYGSQLIPLTPSNYGSVFLPSWQAKGQDTPTNIGLVTVPLVTVSGSDLGENRAIVQLPAWKARGTDNGIFNIFTNSGRVRLPSWRTEDPALKFIPIQLPAWKAKGYGPNFGKATLPSWATRGGDDLNLGLVTLPMWAASGIGQVVEAPSASGQVIVPMGFVIEFNGKTGDDPLGGEDTPPMETSTLVCVIVGEMSAFSEMALATETMIGILGGDIGVIREATLQTVDMIGILGGEIDTQAESTLPAEVMFLMLGGSIGGEASSPQDVVQWAGVAEFDAANDVFCASIENGGVGGTTRYRAYAFNSFATISGKHYGANANGLFLLDGNTDSAERIAAQFGFGQLDFGKPNLKTISYCYLGAKAGAMRLSIDSLVDGKPTLSNYAARGHGSSIREVRFDLGRGLRSTYVMPTFYNTNGDDFEVDTVRFLIAESTRRI